MEHKIESEEQQWKFNMELLSNIHTLRVYLLASGCSSVSASLLSPCPSLSCKWSTFEGFQHSTVFSLPLLLFDYTVRPYATAQPDHIEICLRLLPLSLSVSKAENEGRRLGSRINPDVVNVSQGSKSSEGVTISCTNCSAVFLRNSIREFVELPCVEWREVVEHWFGTCCCSFGSRAQSISSSYEKSLLVYAGRCLVGLSTFLVDWQDLNSKAFLETSKQGGMIPKLDEGLTKDKEDYSKIDFLACGNGFMVWENEFRKSRKWVPFTCACCSSTIGIHCDSGDENLNATIFGVHLFQCKVLVFSSDGCVFRGANVKSLFAKELLIKIEENGSHRFLVQSLISELPLLQLVVLNSDVLISTGVCFDIARMHERFKVVGDFRKLQRSIKFMFADCSHASLDQMRCIEQWKQTHDIEVIYMLDEFVDQLKTELNANSLCFPPTFGSLEHLQVSFLIIGDN